MQNSCLHCRCQNLTNVTWALTTKKVALGHCSTDQKHKTILHLQFKSYNYKLAHQDSCLYSKSHILNKCSVKDFFSFFFKSFKETELKVPLWECWKTFRLCLTMATLTLKVI